MDKLWVRLLIGFAVVLAVAVGTAALIANRATASEFENYVGKVTATYNSRVGRLVGRVYHQQGWNGVAPYVQQLAEASNLQIVITDKQDQVVIDSDGKLVGRSISSSSAMRGATSSPVVGYLEMLRDGMTEPTPETIAGIHEEASTLKRLVDDLTVTGQLPFWLLPAQDAVPGSRPRVELFQSSGPALLVEAGEATALPSVKTAVVQFWRWSGLGVRGRS